MKSHKIAIPFIPLQEFNVPIIKFYIEDAAFYAIVDTGAESTILDESIKDKLTISDNDEISIVGVSGESTPQKIQLASVKIWMKNDTGHVFIADVSGYVTGSIEHLSEHFLNEEYSDSKIVAILGSDMLDQFHAKVNFIKKEVIFSI